MLDFGDVRVMIYKKMN